MFSWKSRDPIPQRLFLAGPIMIKERSPFPTPLSARQAISLSPSSHSLAWFLLRREQLTWRTEKPSMRAKHGLQLPSGQTGRANFSPQTVEASRNFAKLSPGQLLESNSIGGKKSNSNGRQQTRPNFLQIGGSSMKNGGKQPLRFFQRIPAETSA